METVEKNGIHHDSSFIFGFDYFCSGVSVDFNRQKEESEVLDLVHSIISLFYYFSIDVFSLFVLL